jgi:hypothetical protein
VPDLTESGAPDLSIPLVSIRRQRAQRVQKLQHAVPAVALLVAGAQGLLHGERGFALALAVFEIGVSALLLRSLVKELREALHPHHAGHGSHGVDWFDFFAAGVLTAEALEHWHIHHHLPRPTLLLAAVTLLLGLFHGRVAARAARRRHLRIDAAGIRIRGRFFRRFFASWTDLERIDLDAPGDPGDPGGRWAHIVARDGRKRRIDLADLRNAQEVRDALLAAREHLTPAESLPPVPEAARLP